MIELKDITKKFSFTDQSLSQLKSEALTPLRIFSADFILLFISFFCINFIKRGHFSIRREYVGLLLLFYLCWFITALTAKKFQTKNYNTYWNGIQIFVKSNLYLTYSISFIVVFFGLVGYSRVQIFSTLTALFCFESVLWTVFFRLGFEKASPETEIKADNLYESQRENRVSFGLICFDILLVFASFFLINLVKRGDLVLLPEYDKLLLIILGLWFVTALATKKFYINIHLNFYFNLWQWLKAGFLTLALTSVIVFGLRLFYYSRFQGFGTVLLLMLLEVIALTFYFWRKKETVNKKDVESVEEVKNIIGQEALPLTFDIEAIRQKLMEPARIKLEKRLLKHYPDFFAFINENIDLDEMIRLETAVENSPEPIALHSDKIPVRLFLNLHKINDIRKINKYFLQVHQMLLPGGYFVGEAHTIWTHMEWVYSKFPRQIAHVVYTLDFCFKRIMPKLPGFKNIYFALTKGKNRTISKAEMMGRLCFCGFEIVAEKEINKRLCVIARKVKTPSIDTNPTYGPLVTLKRSGSNGSVLHIYKFRTMHPYSEYLQQYVFNLQGLQKGGKLEDDFRMTAWGKFMRKCWLDELPMLYNWLKGDLQLFGVRPLSFHYLSLYDSELKELRKHVKPGLIPPFYADLPETFDEICDSERRYIKAFLKNPIKTQLSYFSKAFVNIALKGARSG